jgi:uncharacterized protein YggT (Ycf19 family)
MAEKMLSSIVISVRVDVRSVVELARYFDSQQQPVNTIGTLLRQSVESLAANVRRKLPELLCSDLSTAHAELQQRGLQTKKVRARQELLREVSLDELDLTAAHRPQTQTQTQTQSASAPFNPDLLREATERLAKREEAADDNMLAELLPENPAIYTEDVDETDAEILPKND